MKKLIVILAFVLLAEIGFYLQYATENKCKVLKIDSPCEIYIDYNKNLIFDEKQPFRLTNIYFIEYEKDYSDDEILSQLTAEEKFFLNTKAENYAEEILKNKYINIEADEIIVNEKKYTDILLDSQLFYTNDDKSKQKIIDKIRTINTEDYFILNTKSATVHKLSCPHGRLAKRFKIIKNEQKKSDFKLCGFCFGKQNPSQNSNLLEQNKYSSPSKPFVSEVFEQKNIKIYFIDLNKISAPSKKCTTKACTDLKNEIDNAKETIDFAVYGINNQPEIVNSLKKALNRGVKIRWVCDFDKKNINYYPDTEPLKRLIPSYNTDEDYEKNNKSAIMHNKFFIFDKTKVWTGSANITGTDLTGFNANYALLVSSPETADIYTKEFEQMYKNKFHTEKDKITKSEIKINDKTVLLPLFSPADNIMEYIIKEINAAENSIYIPVFFITHKSLIDPLANAHSRGVDIKIIDDATNAHTQHSIHKSLRQKGIKVKTENYAGKMHMKAIIIDDTTSIMGSMNYTKSGNNRNDENVLVIKDKEITKYMKESFLYLWNKIPDEYLKYDPYAESFSSAGSCTDGIDNDFDGKTDQEDEGCQYKKTN